LYKIIPIYREREINKQIFYIFGCICRRSGRGVAITKVRNKFEI
jgi:hypothetical protein